MSDWHRYSGGALSTQIRAGSAGGGQSPTTGSRLDGIEGLRALAALSVFVDHALIFEQGGTPDLGNVGGWIYGIVPDGLTLFFALSGFLLYRPYAAAIIDGRALPRTGPYLRNRALRILPAYWVILIVVALGLGIANLHSAATIYGPTGYLWGHPGTFFASLALIQNYIPSQVLAGIGPSWSLGAEIVFYLSLPLLGWLAARLARGRSRTARIWVTTLPAFVLAGIGLLGNLWASRGSGSYGQVWGDHWHAVLERSFLPNADLFATGAAAAVVLLVVDRSRDGGASVNRYRTVAGGGAIVVAILSWVARHEGTVSGSLAGFGVSIASGLLILHVTLPSSERPGPALRIFASRWATSIGMISYSIYLWHEPVIRFLHKHGLTAGGRVGWFLDTAYSLVIVLALASLSYRFVERPAMARKRRMTAAAVAIPDAGEEAAMVEAAP